MKTSEKGPRVSIALPVYNGEKYVGEAIESVLAQTFKDFELIVSDNASTDRTEQICREYVDKDRRIRYYRNKKNLGGAKNFNRAFELSSGEYFKWLAADCTIEPEFLERCVDLLDNDSEIILACTYNVGRIEMDDITIRRKGNFALRSRAAHQRFRNALNRVVGRHGNGPIWAVMRSNVLRETSLLRSFIGSDDCILLELALKGKFGQVPEFLTLLRRHPESFTDIKKSNSGIEGIAEAQFIDPNIKGKFFLPHWRRLWEYFLLAVHSEENWPHKLMMVASIFYPPAVRSSKVMIKELIFAARLGKPYMWMVHTIRKHCRLLQVRVRR
jgi:glycosyltransferase involved in cell wall biosynthesis